MYELWSFTNHTRQDSSACDTTDVGGRSPPKTRKGYHMFADSILTTPRAFTFETFTLRGIRYVSTGSTLGKYCQTRVYKALDNLEDVYSVGLRGYVFNIESLGVLCINRDDALYLTSIVDALEEDDGGTVVIY